MRIPDWANTESEANVAKEHQMNIPDWANDDSPLVVDNSEQTRQAAEFMAQDEASALNAKSLSEQGGVNVGDVPGNEDILTQQIEVNRIDAILQRSPVMARYANDNPMLAAILKGDAEQIANIESDIDLYSKLSSDETNESTGNAELDAKIESLRGPQRDGRKNIYNGWMSGLRTMEIGNLNAKIADGSVAPDDKETLDRIKALNEELKAYREGSDSTAWQLAQHLPALSHFLQWRLVPPPCLFLR